MAASGRVAGVVLTVSGVALGLIIAVWLAVSSREAAGGRVGGAILGGVLALGCLVLPLVGVGAFMLVRGQSEARDLTAVRKQRAFLNMVETRGQVKVSDIALENNSSVDDVRNDLYELVGKGLFTGYVDWNGGTIYARQASELRGKQQCPNCGGRLELAGKGLIKCPYCGAEIFLAPESGARAS